MKSLIRNIKGKYDYISVQRQINSETATSFTENQLKINPKVVILTGWQEQSVLPAQSQDADGKMWYIVRVRSINDESDASRLDPFEFGLSEHEILDRIQSHRQAQISVESVPDDGGKICAFNIWNCSYSSITDGVGRGPIILENHDSLPNPNRIIQIKKGRQWDPNGANTLGSMSETSGQGWSAKPGVKLINETEVNFITLLTERLRNKGFSKDLVVNSTTRTPQQQIAAVTKQVKNNPKWFDNKYTSNSFSSYRKVIKAELDKGPTQWSTAIMEREVQKAMQNGIYMSKHLKSGAFDIQTSLFDYATANTVVEEIKSMISEGVGGVTFVDWENVSGDNLALRKSGSSAIYGEHIHVGLR